MVIFQYYLYLCMDITHLLNMDPGLDSSSGVINSLWCFGFQNHQFGALRNLSCIMRKHLQRHQSFGSLLKTSMDS